MGKVSEDRVQMLADVITTAVEGGTGYWACVSEYRWEGLAPADCFAVLHEQADGADEGSPTIASSRGGEYLAEGLRLDVAAVRRGMARILEDGNPLGLAPSVIDVVRTAQRDPEVADLDAEAADLIAQAALLGEIRYG